MPTDALTPVENIHEQLDAVREQLDALRYAPTTTIQLANELTERIRKLDNLSFEIFRREIKATTEQIKKISDGIDDATASLKTAIDNIDATAERLQQVATVLDIVDKILILAANVML